MSSNKQINYVNKDFTELKNNLVEYAKTYYPQTYNDFSATSPGMMFIELAAYVGDILSFYIDNQIQENFTQYSRQLNNIYELAYMFGYKPKTTSPATTEISFYQQVPSLLSGSSYVPDFSYCLNIEPNSVISSNLNNSIRFLVEDNVNFAISSSLDPTEISVFSVDTNNDPTFFLLKKKRKAISATIYSNDYTFGSHEKFPKININNPNIIGILDVIDSDNNEWFEVDYLGQETIIESIKNTQNINPLYYNESSDIPYILKLKKQSRRFTSRFIDKNNLQIEFGSGKNNDTDEEIIPNQNNVGLGTILGVNKMNNAYSPNNFLNTNTYGIAPTNTTLTIRYLVGGGISSNVNQNELTNITGDIKFINKNLNSSLANYIFDTLLVNNEIAADGGGDGDSIEDIRQKTLMNFSSQLRSVSQDDYLIRIMSLPNKFGVISKVFIDKTKSNQNSNSILDLYILSYNNKKELIPSSQILKQNIKNYLSLYTPTEDFINIKDGIIINIELFFDIIILPGFNYNEILLNCITELKSFFEIDKWQINQPIILRDIYILLDKVKGVQTVKEIQIKNVSSDTSPSYSEYSYDIESATLNNIIYPSLDPMIFELKYPDVDIKGKISNF